MSIDEVKTPSPLKRAAWLWIALVTIPFLASLAGDQKPERRESGKGQKGPGITSAIIQGRVVDESGHPLADVHILVAVPSTDMRFRIPNEGHKLLETRSDSKGNYRIELPWITKPTTASIDATKPGYCKLAGPIMSGDGGTIVEIAPRKIVDAPLSLDPSLYLAGVVVDEKGNPIPSAWITATFNSAGATAYVEQTASRGDGSFEIFNYPSEPFAIEKGQVPRGEVALFERDYVDGEIADIYALKPEQHTTLRVVLKTGHRLSGTVLDVSGKPAAQAIVKVIGTNGTRRKVAQTDLNGRFELRGVAEGPAVLTARVSEMRQRLTLPVTVEKDQIDLRLRLKPTALGTSIKTYNVLGMQLADLTPELCAACDIDRRSGVLVVDPGKNGLRLDVGELAKGDWFWCVGDTRVGSVRGFVRQLLSEVTDPNAALNRVRIVYAFSRIDFEGSNTQQLKLTTDDLKQLQAVLAEIAASDQNAAMALEKNGARVLYSYPNRLGAIEPGPRWREVSNVTLGREWKGGDDLRKIAEFPTVDRVFVTQAARVTDKALDSLRKLRPEIVVDRVSDAFLGIESEQEPGASGGITIREVVADSPADRAGLRMNDVLVEIAGKPVPDFPALRKFMLPLKPGQSVMVKVIRDDLPLSLTVELGERN